MAQMLFPRTIAITQGSGLSAKRFQTTPARSKARPEPRSMENGCHGDRHRTGIISAKVSKDEHRNAVHIYAHLHANVHWLAGPVIVNSITANMFNNNSKILTLASCHRVDPHIAITTCSVRVYSFFKLSPLLTDNLDR